MAKLIYALLFLSVWYGGVKGDAACFLQKISECGQRLAAQISPQEHDFVLCKLKDELFACIRESAVECSVDQWYKFDFMEVMYDEFCTDGSPLNLDMKKHKECIYNTLVKSSSCAKDIYDFSKHIKELTPEVIKDLGKLTCRERKNINNCYLRNVEEQCGIGAKVTFNIYIGPSDIVNEVICRDILNE